MKKVIIWLTRTYIYRYMTAENYKEFESWINTPEFNEQGIILEYKKYPDGSESIFVDNPIGQQQKEFTLYLEESPAPKEIITKRINKIVGL